MTAGRSGAKNGVSWRDQDVSIWLGYANAIIKGSKVLGVSKPAVRIGLQVAIFSVDLRCDVSVVSPSGDGFTQLSGAGSRLI